MHVHHEMTDDIAEVADEDLTDWAAMCVVKIAYINLKEEAERRLCDATYGSVMYNLKLVRYIEYRAMREAGYVV